MKAPMCVFSEVLTQSYLEWWCIFARIFEKLRFAVFAPFKASMESILNGRARAHRANIKKGIRNFKTERYSLHFVLTKREGSTVLESGDFDIHKVRRMS